jgi:hypothetical protein
MIRIVTITPDTPYTPAEGEEVLDRRAEYNGEIPKWHLLVGKDAGKGTSETAKLAWDLTRDARNDAKSEQVLLAFAAAFSAFGEGLKTPAPKPA